MANRDIKLIIRAKNEASKTLDSVNAALKELADSQSIAAASASKADSNFGALGQEVEKLSKELAKLTALKSVADSLQKAASAVSTMSTETKRVATDFAALAREADKAKTATDRLRGQGTALAESYRTQKDSIRAAKLEQRDATKEMTRSEAALKRLQAQLDKQGRVSSFAAKTQGSAKTSAEVFLQADVGRAKGSVDATTAAIKREEAALTALGNELAQVNKQITVSAQNHSKLAKSADSAAADLAKSKGALAGSKAELTQVQGAAEKAAQSLGGLTLNQKHLEEQTEATSKQLRESAELMKAMSRYSTGGGGFADPKTAASIRKQREEMEAARSTWAALEAEARRLAAEMRATVNPTEQQAAAFRNAAAAARAAKVAFESAQASVGRLSNTTKGGFTALSQVDGGLRRVAAQARQVGNDMQQAVGKLNGIRDIFGAFYGESRKAMNVGQRVRGEILSLATAYVGLYGTIQNIGGVITAYQQLESAQSRLGVAFGQDQTRVGQELGWLERQAARLGITFGTLSEEYAKFAVASQMAGFSTDETRKTFLAVAESARVLKLSQEDTQGVFRALSQMISKGKVQAEELRGQLGDRLTGAFQLFATAIGVTTAELDDMLKKGEVIADKGTFLKFADRLNEFFGPQLATALKSTTTEIGKFQNSLFQAKLQFARGGFIEGLTEGLRELNEWFATREGRDFFLNLGAAAGDLVKVLAVLPQHFGLIVDAVKLVLALKFTFWLTGASRSATEFRNIMIALWSAIKLVPSATSLAGTGLSTLGRSMRTVGGAVTAARAAFLGLRAAMMAVPGIGAGIALFAVTEFLFSWLTGVKDITRAMDEHQRQMGIILSAYDQAKGKAKAWAREIKGLTPLEAEQNLRNVLKAFREAREDARVPSLGLVIRSKEAFEQIKELEKLQDAFIETGEGLDEYREKVEAIGNAATDPKVRQHATNMLAATEATEAGNVSLREHAKIVKEAQANVDLLSGAITEAEHRQRLFGDQTDETTDSLDTGATSVDKYTTAINKLKEAIPELAEEMERVKNLAEIDANFGEAINNIRTTGYPGDFMLRDQANQAFNLRDRARMETLLKEIAGNTKVSSKLFNMIHGEEGFRSKAYPDGGRNRFSIGFGSQTVNGRAVRKGDTITEAAAVNQAVLDLGTLVNQIEAMVKVPLSESQLNALVSYAYNAGIGSLKRDGILQPLNRGDYAGAQEAIRSGVDTSQGRFLQVLRDRREREAAMFGGEGGSVSERLETEKLITEEQRKQAELRAEESLKTKEFISDKQFELEQGKLIAAGKGREAAIESAIRDAKKQNVSITKEQLAQVIAVTGALYDQKHATDEIEAAEKRVTDLKQLQQELMTQITYFQDQGEHGKVEALKTQLEGVNKELAQAIQQAIQMYQALGGPGADLAIAKLNTAALNLDAMGQKAVVTGTQVNEMLAGGLAGVFDKFAAAVARGENAVGALKEAFLQFASDFLREIAQMIIKQALLNMLQGGSNAGGGVGGMISGLIGRLFHSGGIAGTSGPSRTVSPAWFQNAMRYHDGGIAGLKPGEVPAILKRGEEVLTEDNPRHIANGGGAEGGGTKVINAFDAASFLSEALNSKVGEKVILNFVRANPGAFKQALQGN